MVVNRFRQRTKDLLTDSYYETVTVNNSPTQDYVHSDDHAQSTHVVTITLEHFATFSIFITVNS